MRDNACSTNVDMVNSSPVGLMQTVGALPLCTVIVSDVRLLCEGLTIGLEKTGEVRVIGTAATVEAVSELLTIHASAVVLLDSGMPGALELARDVLQARSNVRIVAVAVSEDGPEIVACAEAGLIGYVPRDGSIADVVNATRNAMINELHCSPKVSAVLFKHLASNSISTPTVTSSNLTAREAQILELIDLGLSNKQIGQRLRIGTATVKNHIHNLLDKLHVKRRAEAAALMRAQRYGHTLGRHRVAEERGSIG